MPKLGAPAGPRKGRIFLRNMRSRRHELGYDDETVMRNLRMARISVSRATFYTWDSAKTACPLYVAHRLAKMLRVSLEELSGEDQPNTAQP